MMDVLNLLRKLILILDPHYFLVALQSTYMNGPCYLQHGLFVGRNRIQIALVQSYLGFLRLLNVSRQLLGLGINLITFDVNVSKYVMLCCVN